METMKTCTKCSISKPIGEYNKHKQTKDGLNSWCRKCTYTQNKEYNNRISAVYEIYDGDISLYIGQSKQYLHRRNKHKSLINHPKTDIRNEQFYNALQQHPNASIRVVEECSREVLLEREQHYIDAKKPLYNKYVITT
jgi:DNA replicative helicase MCM subunit Mcm2 (Cdc46/Mcm family)